MNYETLIASKITSRIDAGFELSSIPGEFGLFDFQEAIVKWAARMGRCAVFADCGLGKTRVQLAWADAVANRLGGPVLIYAPLTVAQQTAREAAEMGLVAKVAKTGSDICESGIWIANYERHHLFSDLGEVLSGIVLDESSILKSVDGKTRTALLADYGCVPYRICCTATPAPNDITEIANHAEFLGVKTRTEMLAHWFVHDDEGWRLKGHASADFWRWLATWSVYLRTPADIGFPSDAYHLPPLQIQQVVVETDAVPEGYLLPVGDIKGIVGRSQMRRSTLEDRVEAAARIVEADPGRSWILWTGLNDESDALLKRLDHLEPVSVEGKTPEETKIANLAAFIDGRARILVSKPRVSGFGMNFQHCSRQIFVGIGDSWEAYYQCLRRSYRFGQTQPVQAWIVVSDAEQTVLENVMRKEKEAITMGDSIISHVSDLSKAALHGEVETKMTPDYTTTATGPDWTLHNGDCVPTLASKVAADSIDLSVYSPPFATLYTYSDNPRDMGNCVDHAQFFEQFKFFIAELLRVTKPGRLTCVHVAQVPANLGKDGYIGIQDFRGACIDAYIKSGFVFHREVCIDKCPQALRNGTPVLTPTGWVPIESLKIGDSVIGSFGKRTIVLGVWPQGERDLYRVEFKDGSFVFADARHLWTVAHAQSGKQPSWKTMTTQDLGIGEHETRGRWRVPNCQPVEFWAGEALRIHPYTLGVMLGDGCISQARHIEFTSDCEIAQTLPLPEFHRTVKREGSERASGSVATYGIVCEEWHRNGVMTALREYGLQGKRSWEKFIPKPYLFSSIENRRELLAGLLDTDGTVKRNKAVCYSTTSKRLANDILHLVRSLGGNATIRECAGSKYTCQGEVKEGRTIYKMNISIHGMNPFKLSRKAEKWRRPTRAHRRIIKSITPATRDECTCITVSANDGLFVTKDFLVTHNSQAIRTHSKALLFVQMKKDRSWSGPALADYILVFRKPGDNAVPIRGNLSNDEWIEWARPIWYGIKESNTLNAAEARSEKDERHICLAAGSLVLTRDGYIPIETVQIGDMVLTHQGRWMPVTGRVCNGIQPIVRLCAQGVADLRVTPDHKLWARNGKGDKSKIAAQKVSPDWVKAESSLGSYLNLKLPPIEESPLSEKEWWIIGRWLGDGHKSIQRHSGKRNGQGSFVLSCSHKEAPGLLAFLGDCAGHDTSAHKAKRTATQVTLLIRSEVKTILNRCGTGATGKRLPAECLCLDPDKSEALLAGYLSADGHLVKRYDRYMASSVSRALLLGMAIVAQRARGCVASVYAGRPGGESTIQGRPVTTSQDWVFSFRNSPGYRPSGWIGSDGAWKKVRKIEAHGDCEVWDISVAEDASFTAEGCIVKNCPLQLGVIDRCVKLWSNPGELVLSPFAGIGSEGYQSLKAGRRFVGVELKPEYYKVACRNLRKAEATEGDLFAEG